MRGVSRTKKVAKNGGNMIGRVLPPRQGHLIEDGKMYLIKKKG